MNYKKLICTHNNCIGLISISILISEQAPKIRSLEKIRAVKRQMTGNKFLKTDISP
jgi:hypothetical protein